ncbi:Uncharacterised protein [Mycobacteroides abscessus subsp. abscessus]|uniref:hypothetical protein n=1 Tax=Mycobacteroides abscessus TaxID=36809 RepID=UPI00092B8BF8|nr:hypothetical protein [Mycobacteroides abscessus]SHX89611.1 Uncharacterised protein [Mycobacteroides abscessus subsp. abscessus]SIF60547.1 Uncharacterised protein [Mycobacteroides abscessus subsp. abscessus]
MSESDKSNGLSRMDIQAARDAIEEILAAIPDELLPMFDKVSYDREGMPTVWCGGSGRVLGSARRNGVRDPSIYRRDASWSAIEYEMAYRADRRLHENGDDPKGIELARKVRR